MATPMNPGVGLTQLGLSCIGMGALGLQLWKLGRRRSLVRSGRQIEGEHPSAAVHLGLYTYSFYSYVLVIVYAFALGGNDHRLYLAAPRFILILLVLACLWFVFDDRRDRRSKIAVVACSISFALTLLLFTIDRERMNAVMPVLQPALLIDGFILAVLAFLQNHAIRNKRTIGGVSAPMHVIFFAKNVSLLLYGFMVGKNDGWGLMGAAIVNLIVQCETLWLLWRFRHTLRDLSA